MAQIQYISAEQNNITGVIVPIDLWHELQAEKEIAYLPRSEAMKEHLVAVRKREQGASDIHRGSL